MRIEHKDPTEAARSVLELYWGFAGPVPDRVLSQMVDAALRAADTVMTRRIVEHRELWEREDFRSHIRAAMRRELAFDVAEQGHLPVCLPVETLLYANDPYAMAVGPDGEPDRADRWMDAELVEAGAPWTHVQIRLEVAVRTPAVDRPAAIREGAL